MIAAGPHSTRFQHVLLVGCTGMLAGAAEWVLARSRRAVVTGRNEATLRAVAATSANVMPWRIDIRRLNELRAGFAQPTAAHGPFDLALVWLHDDAAAALPVIAEHVGSEGLPGRLVVVLGCGAEDPSLGGAEPEQALAVPGVCAVQSVVLGFVREGARSRWLTHEEISSGAIAAIESGRRKTIVGVVTPWSDHPPL